MHCVFQGGVLPAPLHPPPALTPTNTTHLCSDIQKPRRPSGLIAATLFWPDLHLMPAAAKRLIALNHEQLTASLALLSWFSSRWKNAARSSAASACSCSDLIFFFTASRELPPAIFLSKYLVSAKLFSFFFGLFVSSALCRLYPSQGTDRHRLLGMRLVWSLPPPPLINRWWGLGRATQPGSNRVLSETKQMCDFNANVSYLFIFLHSLIILSCYFWIRFAFCRNISCSINFAGIPAGLIEPVLSGAELQTSQQLQKNCTHC